MSGMLGKTRRTRRGPASHSDTATSPIIINGVGRGVCDRDFLLPADELT